MKEEFKTIVDATYAYGDWVGGHDFAHRRDRLRALVLLMRWSGLAIKDAVTLERTRVPMNQAAEKSLNGNIRGDQRTPEIGAPLEGSQPPSVEAKKPFIAEKKKATGRDNWKAIVAGIALIAVILVAALTHKSGVKTKASSPTEQQVSRALKASQTRRLLMEAQRR